MESKRLKILNFLQWNDRNGSYTDIEAINEGLEPLTFVESIKMFVHVICEHDGDFTQINITKEYRRYPKVKNAFIILMNGLDNVGTYRKVIKIL